MLSDGTLFAFWRGGGSNACRQQKQTRGWCWRRRFSGSRDRGSFRDAAVELLEGLPEQDGTLLIDFARTRRIDSAGLGALMLIQRRASER